MKKFLFLASALFMFIAFQAQAQQPQRGPRERMTPEQQATRMVENLNKDVKLTAEQQKELTTWFTNSFKKRMETFQKNTGMSREAMMEQMKKDNEATDAQLKKVLTAEQYKTFQEIQKKRMEMMRQRQQQGNRPGGPQRGLPRN